MPRGGYSALPPNKQFERTVIRRRVRVADGPFHHAPTVRGTAQHAAAQRRQATT
jgi:hypothetical protein